MPFAAPLNWPLTLIWATWALTILMTTMWWFQLPSLPRLMHPTIQSSYPWNW